MTLEHAPRTARDPLPEQRDASSVDVTSILAGGGEMGALMRSMDWSTTPLGPVSNWSQALRSTVSLLLHNHAQMMLWWGPEFVQFYNDAYRPVLGDKHPRALGQPFAECWTEVIHIVGPMAERPFLGGPASTADDLPLMIRRKVPKEESHFQIAYCAVPDPTVPVTGIGGVLAIVTEITEQTYGQRQLRTLRELGTQNIVESKTPEAACAAAAAALRDNRWDVPFALFYLFDDDGKRAQLAANVGFAATTLDEVAPAIADLSATPTPGAWPLQQAARERRTVVVEDVTSLGSLPVSPWSEQPRSAIALPLASPDQANAYGVLVCGISPHRVLDDGYRTFFELAAAQISTAIRNALAYQTERRRAETLAEIDRAKTAFFSNVSHEFRTPLTLMLGPTEDLLAGSHGDLSGDQRAQLELLRRNELRLQRLVNALLEFSRIEAGRVQAMFEPTDLGAFTRDLASSFRSAVERAGLTFTIDCEAFDEPVFVDRNMWEQIVLNLLSNAFKFTFEGGIEVMLRVERDRAMLRVQDTGVGVRAEDIPRLFERFHRVEGTRARTHEGSGIGLALVQELVRLHGGAIRAASTFGQGTSFTIEIPMGSAHLPRERITAQPSVRPNHGLGVIPFVEEAERWLPELAPVDDRSAPDDSRPAPPGDVDDAVSVRPRIVVADDNADMRAYLRRVLEANWSVETVSDGVAALAAIHAQRPDAVVTDVMMPNLDGFGLLRTLRADPATAAIPIIMLSARAGEESRVEGLSVGADDYLVKPFSARELVARVRTQLKLARAHQHVDAQWRRIFTVLRQVPISIALISMPERWYEFVNEAHIRMIGRDGMGLGVDEALSHLSEADRSHYRELQDRTFEANELIRIPEVGRTTRDGTRYYDVTMAPWIEHDGRKRGVISASIDITDQVMSRHNVEEAHDRAVRGEIQLRHAMALRDGFLSVASHELRTPLTTLGLQIESLVSSLEALPEGPNRDRALTRAEKLRRQGDRFEALVAGMLDGFGLDAASVQLKREDIELGSVVRTIAERLSRASQKANSVIDVRAESVRGRWDRERLEQIVVHLMTNAVKFGQGNPIEVAVDATDDTAQITVTDHGIGIAKADHERVFERFERASPSHEYGGFGLGLWIVRELVMAMNGSVSVNSEPGAGATFTVTLPRCG